MFVQFNEHQILTCGTVLREYFTANIFDEFVLAIYWYLSHIGTLTSFIIIFVLFITQ